MKTEKPTPRRKSLKLRHENLSSVTRGIRLEVEQEEWLTRFFEGNRKWDLSKVVREAIDLFRAREQGLIQETRPVARTSGGY